MIRKRSLLIMLICIAVLIFSQCLNSVNNNDPRGSLYAGSAVCADCHKEIYSSYLHTAHYHSVSVATPASVHGSFAKDSNVFIIDSNRKVVMEKSNSGLYQVYYSAKNKIEAQRFDIVFGLIKGETYLYWKDDQLFQLPISYSNPLHQWAYAPGYNPAEVSYNRAIRRRCFECHSSYIQELPQPETGIQAGDVLDKKSVIYNIDCERCHGPAAAHVNFQIDNPSIKTAQYIASYSSLSRVQKTGMCAQCHSGNKSIMVRSIFSFKPGDTLARYMLPDFAGSTDTNYVDVHGNQMQLLARSKCFIQSNMDCATCHNTHENERGNLTLYNQRCKNCHANSNHDVIVKINPGINNFINSNCINCHMPVQQSKKIIMQTSNKGPLASATVVNHRIAIYPEETKRIIKLFHN